MSERQYGIAPGTKADGRRTPVSPLSTNRNSISGSRDYRIPQPAYSQEQYYRGIGQSSGQVSPVSARSGPPPPPPPPHRSSMASSPQRASMQRAVPPPMFIGADGNESDLDFDADPSRHGFLRDVDNLFGAPQLPAPSPELRETYTAYRPASGYPQIKAPQRPLAHQHTNSQASVTSSRPLISAAAPPAIVSTSNVEERMPGRNSNYFQGDGYDNFDPRDIADDNDYGPDGHVQPPKQRRQRRHSKNVVPVAAASVGTATGEGASNFIHPFSRLRDPSGNYASINSSNGLELPDTSDPEKSEWLENQSNHSKRVRWILIVLVALVVIGAIVGGTVGGVLAPKNSSSSSTSGSGSTDSNSQYTIHSGAVQDLLDNKNLRKVFPGMDYTPLNAQYPDCLTTPPDQNNITLDLAVLSQLTPAVRLYGTDCNQTEMVLSAISALEMEDSLQVWLGVWLGTNQTTNSRQLDQMYTLLNSYPASRFAGVIIGNEVLYRKDLTEDQLGTILHTVRTNLTSRGITSLPVSTSDLGDNWTPALAADTDIVMANVHPFFAGEKADAASSWTWQFWQNKDANLATNTENKGSWPKSIISETGWPSDGGNDCGTGSASCAQGEGAVAGVDEMNTFMDDFVCASLQNQTTYFWFEAFDEPWKVIYNTDSDQWESKWGLFDSDRNMKDGVNIPDCNGQRVDKAWF
ncbi:glycoside hydrolase family 17 protein [Polychaeton citri CBS 116435]|uniref:glucan endo-1,3-beta-D-glucosidase n=1 Tax=Polychaeton citri CBS 116435 TaxID=1314669 RepID=A0A9P4QDS2_9PEZI|nr:glycoside hydrolase family 17 protein [Polychaeton citri CBS 116435]